MTWTKGELSAFCCIDGDEGEKKGEKKEKKCWQMLEEMISYTSCQREQRETAKINKQFENKWKKLLTNFFGFDKIDKLLQTSGNELW